MYGQDEDEGDIGEEKGKGMCTEDNMTKRGRGTGHGREHDRGQGEGNVRKRIGQTRTRKRTWRITKERTRGRKCMEENRTREKNEGDEEEVQDVRNEGGGKEKDKKKVQDEEEKRGG